MGKNSAISWTEHTFAPWFGCTRVSPGCDLCYAEVWTARFHKAEWGSHAARKRAAASTWRGPIKWDREAAERGLPARVFCSELSDVFDNQAPDSWRDDLWHLIRSTPHLDWLLLTKRPQNMRRMLPSDWRDGWPNVWLGATTENQIEADRRVPQLLSIPAARRWLSAEPLLEPINLHPWLGPAKIEWIIVGGESDQSVSKVRPMMSAWARTVRDQCRDAGAALYFKQTGSHPADWPIWPRGKGDNPRDWPADLRIQQSPPRRHRYPCPPRRSRDQMELLPTR